MDPCRNGATCIDGVNSYTCNCSPGYEGTDCETDIDDCASTPCLNGGACVDGVNLYTCNCANTGFTGDTCDTDIDECEVAPCLHNSTCHNEVNDYTCDCHAGYTDKNCGVDIRECEAEPCQNNATCYELSDTALYNVSLAAALPPGIRGQFLEEFSYERAAGYLCDCPRGFKGNDRLISRLRHETVYCSLYCMQQVCSDLLLPYQSTKLNKNDLLSMQIENQNHRIINLIVQL